MSREPTSDEFDPILALYSPPTDPGSNVKVFDNVAIFEANMKQRKTGTDAEQQSKASRRDKSFSQRKRIAAEVQNRDVSKLKELMELRRKKDEEKKGVCEEENVASSAPPRQRKQRSNLFTVMEKLSVGPLSVLHRATSNKHRCNVYTRHFTGLRGVLCGYIVAYDRYMNLAMNDVDETFILSPRGEVVQHQKKLSVSQLEKVSRDLRLMGINDDSPSTSSYKRGSYRQNALPTTGVVTVKKKSSLLARTEKDDSSKASSTSNVIRYNTRAPPTGKEQTFHGGHGQLYHRHINNLYVRGDSVVLVSLPG